MGKLFSRRIIVSLLAALVLAPSMAPGQDQRQKVVVLILGPPGGGKSTQSKNLSQKYKVPAFSLAEILNKESGWVKNQYKRSLSLPMSTGDFLSDELANQLVSKYITSNKARNGFILDGYPRSLKQAKYLDNTLTGLGLPAPVVVHLSMPDNVAAERLRRRGRKQDKPDIIAARMADYHVESDVILDYYKSSVRVVDGTPSPAAVWASVQQAVGQ